jgi:hypothetical protein
VRDEGITPELWWNDADRKKKSELPGKESASFPVCFVRFNELKIHIFPLWIKILLLKRISVKYLRVFSLYA